MNSETISLQTEGELKSLKEKPKTKIVKPQKSSITIGQNEVIAVFGKRGFGKTYFVKKALIPKYRKVLIFDQQFSFPDDMVTQKEMKKYPGWKLIEEPRELITEMLKQTKQKNLKKRIIIVYRPDQDQIKRDFNFVAEALFRIGHFMFFVDELHDFLTATMVPTAMSKIFRIGRHKGIGFCGITQRPAHVHNTFKSQVEKAFVFKLSLPPDRKYIEDWLGDQSEVVKDLPKFHFLFWDGEEIYKMRPIRDQDKELIEIEEKTKDAVKAPKVFGEDREKVIKVVEEIVDE
jgi:hypothetical protein